MDQKPEVKPINLSYDLEAELLPPPDAEVFLSCERYRDNEGERDTMRQIASLRYLWLPHNKAEEMTRENGIISLFPKDFFYNCIISRATLIKC